MSVKSWLMAGAVAVTFSPLAVSAQSVQITGAGSSFAAPLYGKWGGAAKGPVGVELNYQSVGSGAGVKAITGGNVDFGASDAPVAADKLAAAHLVQFPSAMGAVVIMANVPGVKDGTLKLDGATLAAIYQGDIVKWNDKAIAALNKGVKLPSISIAPVYRADASGTTFVFTSYLSKVSPDWDKVVGAGTSVKWPAGDGANNSNGVAQAVRQVKGGIGYVEFSYAAQNNIPTTLLKSHDGQFVAPTMANFDAAAAKADWSHSQNFAVSILDMPGATSWPIVTPTFVLVPAAPKDPAKTDAVLRMFDWAFTNGAAMAREIDYIPLPKAVQDEIRAEWKSQIKGADGAAVFK